MLVALLHFGSEMDPTPTAPWPGIPYTELLLRFYRSKAYVYWQAAIQPLLMHFPAHPPTSWLPPPRIPLTNKFDTVKWPFNLTDHFLVPKFSAILYLGPGWLHHMLFARHPRIHSTLAVPFYPGIPITRERPSVDTFNYDVLFLKKVSHLPQVPYNFADSIFKSLDLTPFYPDLSALPPADRHTLDHLDLYIGYLLDRLSAIFHWRKLLPYKTSHQASNYRALMALTETPLSYYRVKALAAYYLWLAYIIPPEPGPDLVTARYELTTLGYLFALVERSN